MSWTVTQEAPQRYWATECLSSTLGADGSLSITIGPNITGCQFDSEFGKAFNGLPIIFTSFMGKGPWYFGDAVFTWSLAISLANTLIAKYIPSTSAYSVTLCSSPLSGSIYFRVYDSVKGFSCYMFSNDYILVSFAMTSGINLVNLRVQGWGVAG